MAQERVTAAPTLLPIRVPQCGAIPRLGGNDPRTRMGRYRPCLQALSSLGALLVMLLAAAGLAILPSQTAGSSVAAGSRLNVERRISQLRDEDWFVRMATARALGKAGDERALEPLAALLADERAEVRREAAGALAEIGASRAVPALIRALQHDDPATRCEAAGALAEIGDAGAVDPLIVALGDEDRNVRGAAADALGAIADERAVTALIAALKDEDWYVRTRAVYALGKIKDKRAADALVAALGDEERHVPPAAAWALGELAGASAVDPLIGALQDPNSSVRRQAAEALGKMSDLLSVESLITALGDSDDRVRRAAAHALGCIGDGRAAEPLAAVLSDEDGRVREAADLALAKIRLGLRTVLEELPQERALDLMSAALKSESSAERKVAVESLQKIDDERALGLLIASLNDQDAGVRMKAVNALWEIGTDDAVGGIISALEDNDSGVRCEVAKALGEVGDSRAVEALIGALKDEHELVRRYAAEALKKIGDPRAVEPLIDALSDEYRKVRYEAGEALGKLGDPRAVEPLARALNDPKVNMQTTAAYALGEIGDQRAIEVLGGVLKHHERRVRYAAAWGLATNGWKPPDRSLKAAYLVAAERFDELAAIVDPAAPPSEGGSRVEGPFELDVPTPVELSAGPTRYGPVIRTQWIEFEKRDGEVTAKVGIRLLSWPKSDWRFRVELFDDKDNLLVSADGTVSTIGWISGVPMISDQLLGISIGQWANVSGAAKFALTIAWVPEGGKVVDAVETARPVRRTINDVPFLKPFDRPEWMTHYGAPASAAEDGRLVVPSERIWSDTKLTVAQGQTVEIYSDGQVKGCHGPADDWAYGPWGPDGGKSEGTEHYPSRVCALVGSIDNGREREEFFVGKQLSFEAPLSGTLQLGVSDSFHGDNEGAFLASVKVDGSPVDFRPLLPLELAGEGRLPANALMLTHVDLTSEGKRSLGGSGHAILFERPDDVRFVQAVEIFASRYGHPKPPEEDFHVYLLDENRHVLVDLPYPYSMIERSDLEWYVLGTPPIEVPRLFYVALSFNPHQTKGIFLGYDSDVEESHSFVGLPERGFREVDEAYDWIVRVYLCEQPSGTGRVQPSEESKHEEPVEAPSADRITIRKRGVIVRTNGIDAAYAEAFASILAEASREYDQTFGLPLPDPVELEARLDPEGKLRLWTDGRSRLYLTVTSERQLAPPTKGGPHNVYGMCHELGHMVMYGRMRNLAGLPDGVGEGWAHYAGSVVVDAVAQRLGDAIWPEPFDVHNVDGLGRLRAQVENKELSELSGTHLAAAVFYEIDKRYGREILGHAFANALSRKPTGKELMPRLVASLRELTGDSNAGDWIPADVLLSELRWNVSERVVGDDFFDKLKEIEDETGVLLAYDDGTSEGKKSIAGSGHAVLFRKPEGEWILDGVEVFGSRYGTRNPPEEDFSIYVCDENFVPLREFRRPYSIFERGGERWYKIPLEPLTIPERFYVCLSFSPTATKGVFVHYDDSVSRPHSRSALPYSHVSDVGGMYDWMIRAHLRKDTAPEQ